MVSLMLTNRLPCPYEKDFRPHLFCSFGCVSVPFPVLRSNPIRRPHCLHSAVHLRLCIQLSLVRAVISRPRTNYRTARGLSRSEYVPILRTSPWRMGARTLRSWRPIVLDVCRICMFPSSGHRNHNSIYRIIDIGLTSSEQE